MASIIKSRVLNNVLLLVIIPKYTNMIASAKCIPRCITSGNTPKAAVYRLNDIKRTATNLYV